MVVLLTCLSVPQCVKDLRKPEEGGGSSGTRVNCGCEPPDGCWDLNLCWLED